VKLVEEVRAAQLQAITSSYGVMAAAKAAAPAIAEHVAELAGGKKAADGSRLGRARRDADAIRAADLVLTLSGDKIERHASLHMEVLNEFTDPELEAYATRGDLPMRFQGSAGSSRRLRRPHCLPAVRAPGRPGKHALRRAQTASLPAPDPPRAAARALRSRPHPGDPVASMGANRAAAP
jgi:hypothetical protein